MMVLSLVSNELNIWDTCSKFKYSALSWEVSNTFALPHLTSNGEQGVQVHITFAQHTEHTVHHGN